MRAVNYFIKTFLSEYDQTLKDKKNLSLKDKIQQI